LHTSPSHRSYLPVILGRAGALPCGLAEDRQRIEDGHVYIAPPDWHLTLDTDTMHVTQGPRENRQRPAIDVLFRSAARTAGARSVGIILSGTLDDGVAGLALLKQTGGLTIAQDPVEAAFPEMPRNAIATGRVDHVLLLSAIVELLKGLVAGEGDPMDPAATRPHGHNPTSPPGVRRWSVSGSPNAEASGLVCPECGGALWESDDAGVPVYQCRVRHRFSPASLLEAQGEQLESALWAAIRSLEERAALVRRLAERMQGQHRAAKLWDEQARELEGQARVVRGALEQMRSSGSLHDEPAA
jgi:two-component system, chemotaxis family, protein-glutamate methylesterase/glutaminase